MQNEIIGVLGCKGTGKTTWTKKLYMERNRVLAMDTLGEYGGFICEPPDVRKSLLKYLEDNPQKRTFRIAFRPEKLEDDFNWFCQTAWALGSGTTIIIEEIDFFCQPNFAEPGLDKLIRYGRNRGVNMVYTAKRFPDVSRRLTSQTDRFILFRISEPGDLEGIRKRFGDDLTNRVKALPDFQCLDVDVRTIGQQEEGEREREKVGDPGRV